MESLLACIVIAALVCAVARCVKPAIILFFISVVGVLALLLCHATRKLDLLF